MSQDKKILITNGSGGSGKDTMVQIMSRYIEVEKISSIDLFKKMLEPYTIDYTTTYGKDENYRKLLSTVKSAFVNFNDLPAKEMHQAIVDFMNWSDKKILVIDIREPKEIKKLINIAPSTADIKTILIINDNVADIKSNEADNSVYDYAPYDYIIDNNDTLEVLEDSVVTLLRDLGFEVNKNE